MDPVKNILGGFNKKFHNRKDWDADGVFNKRDCQPRNTMRQDKRKVSKKRASDITMQIAKYIRSKGFDVRRYLEKRVRGPSYYKLWLMWFGGSRTNAMPEVTAYIKRNFPYDFVKVGSGEVFIYFDE